MGYLSAMGTLAVAQLRLGLVARGKSLGRAFE
jgi:hypothetical protein